MSTSTWGLTPDNVTLLIEDDGIGIPDKAPNDRLSHGIAGMRQRVKALHGEFSIGRRPEGGTLIEVNIPLPDQPAQRDASPGPRRRKRNPSHCRRCAASQVAAPAVRLTGRPA